MPKAEKGADFTTSMASAAEKAAEAVAVATKNAELPLVETLEGAADGDYRVVMGDKVRPVRLSTLGASRLVQYLD